MRLCPAALALAAALPLAPLAEAGGYFSIGIGADPNLTGELGDEFDADSTGSSRLGFGFRIGPVALEASAFGAPLARVSPFGSDTEPAGSDPAPAGDYTPISLGVDLKYHLSFLPVVEPYGRAGLNRTWLLTGDASGPVTYEGRGYALGGGFQIPFRALPLVAAAVWADYTRHTTELSIGASDPAPVAGNAHMFMVGVSLGSGL